MFSDFSDEEEDEEETNISGFYHWNNWNPPLQTCSNFGHKSHVSKFENKVKRQSWLPPTNFGSTRQQNDVISNRGNEESQPMIVNTWDEPFNDWGQRHRQNAPYEEIEEGEKTWNIFPPGLFGNFKLERNNYGQIVAFAEAEVETSLDGKIFLHITNEHHLRSLLNVPVEEWNSLIEALGSVQFCLKYEALKKRQTTASIGEKLWYFLCKRRHYLPNIALRIRRNGAKKVHQCFNIFPKFCVEEVRALDNK